MAKIYADLIIKGAINPKTNAPYVLEDVPSKIREEVRKILEENGEDYPEPNEVTK